MPKDTSILKKQPSNGIPSQSEGTGITLEELEQLLRKWVNEILANIDPPSGLWKKIKQQLKNQRPYEDPCS
jgi:hypothetical protein